MERCDRGHIQYSPRLPRHHIGEKVSQNISQSGHVQAQHTLLVVRWHIDKGAVFQHPRVVDQDIHHLPFTLQHPGQAFGTARLRQVGGTHTDHDVVLAGKLIGQVIKFISAARHQNQVVAVLGKHPGERLADARRGAGNQYCFPTLSSHGHSAVMLAHKPGIGIHV